MRRRAAAAVTELASAASTWLHEAVALLERLGKTQAGRDRDRQPVVRRGDRNDGLVHLFGAGHSRIPVEEMFPRYGSYPGFNPIVELSVTFHTQVVGANGQRQAMFIERVPGLAEVILSNFRFGAHDVMMVFSASGLSALPVEMARGGEGARTARDRRHVRGPVDVRRTGSGRRRAPAGGRGPGPRRVHAAGGRDGDHRLLDTPVGPGSTIGAVAIVNAIKVRTAELLVERGAMPPVITRASVVGPARSKALFEAAYREHARRLARAIDQQGGGNGSTEPLASTS